MYNELEWRHHIQGFSPWCLWPIRINATSEETEWMPFKGGWAGVFRWMAHWKKEAEEALAPKHIVWSCWETPPNPSPNMRFLLSMLASVVLAQQPTAASPWYWAAEVYSYWQTVTCSVHLLLLTTYCCLFSSCCSPQLHTPHLMKWMLQTHPQLMAVYSTGIE